MPSIFHWMNNVIAAISRCIAVIVLALVCCVALPVESMAQSQQQTQVDEDKLIPFDQLPPTEQIPAARLLVAAYSFVIVALFLYVLSVARRLNTVQLEVERLEADVKRASRS
jgi:CcmD family protein